jgi:hypothetical protein
VMVVPDCATSGRTPKAITASAARIHFLISFSFLNLGLLVKEPHPVMKYTIPQNPTSAKLDSHRENIQKRKGNLRVLSRCSGVRARERRPNISPSHYPTSEFTFNGRPDA